MHWKSWQVFITLLRFYKTSLLRSVLQVRWQITHFPNFSPPLILIVLVRNFWHYWNALLHLLPYFIFVLIGFLVLQSCLNWGSNLCTEWWYFFKRRIYAFRLKIHNLNTVGNRIRKLIVFYHFSQILNFLFQASVLTFQLIIFINAFF